MTRLEREWLGDIADREGITGIVAFLAFWAKQYGLGGLSWVKSCVNIVRDVDVERRVAEWKGMENWATLARTVNMPSPDSEIPEGGAK